MQSPYLSVVIPTYNRLEKLTKCLNALKKQSLSENSFEVIVVDDGSTDETSQYLEETANAWPTLRVFTQNNRGQGTARNKAIEEALGQIILFIGDDIYGATDFLEKHVEFHQENPKLNIACLGLTIWDESQVISPFMDWLTSGGPQFAYHLLTPLKEASFWFFYTSNLSLKRDLLKEDRFDPDFKYYGFEDIELGYRLSKKGMQLIYQPTALALHDHPMDESSLRQRMHKIGSSAQVFQLKAPELSVVPKGLKKIFLKMASSTPVLICFWLAKSFFPTLAQKKYWYLLSKHYYLEGLTRRGGNKTI